MLDLNNGGVFIHLYFEVKETLVVLEELVELVLPLFVVLDLGFFF